MRRAWLFLTLLACGGESQPAPAPTPVTPPPPATARLDAAPAPADARPAVADAPGPDLAAQPNFNPQLATLFRVAACGGDAPIPERFDARAIERYCTALGSLIEEYRTEWLEIARPVLAEVVPATLPTTVIYPFGGSDLISTLAVYPRADEITIISLEPVGSAKVIDRIGGAALAASLADNRAHLAFLMRAAFHKTVDLKAMSKSGLPGELVDALVALAVHGATPLALRYLTLADDGSITYVDDKFVDVELTFRRADGGLAVYRHIQADLSDRRFGANAGLRAYLAARAPYAAMTKASSFLLWQRSFSIIRDTLLREAAGLVSDATAPLPEAMAAAGFVQHPYGTFTGPEPAFTSLGDKPAPVVELWRKSPGPLPFRFGYGDKHRRGHLLVSLKDPSAAPSDASAAPGDAPPVPGDAPAPSKAPRKVPTQVLTPPPSDPAAP
ncbi:MAG: hypothetical protein R2939_04375 [Kofleriaceae bacterium]